MGVALDGAASLVLFPMFMILFGSSKRTGDSGMLPLIPVDDFHASHSKIAKGLPRAAAFARVGDTAANFPFNFPFNFPLYNPTFMLAFSCRSLCSGHVLEMTVLEDVSRRFDIADAANGLPRAAAFSSVSVDDAAASAATLRLYP